MSIKAPRVFAFVALALLVSAPATFAYQGSLSVVSGQLGGTGFWVNQSALPPAEQPQWIPATITWTVTQNVNQSWHYYYNLTVYRAAVSHWIIETSPNFGQIDLLNPQGPFASAVVGNYLSTNPGNPFMPGDLYGIKFNDTTGTNVSINFDSWRAPVWGDFYAKCGNVGGTQNTAWNLGFLGPDPTGPADNGSLLNHILVPDTVVQGTVPEPAGLMSLGLLGLAGLGFIRRRSA